MGRLDGKVCIITGGASGIGAATAVRFVQEGAAVSIGDIDAKRARSLASDLREQGGRAMAIEADVSKPEDAERLVEHTVEELGALHVLNNNAGIVIPGNVVAQTFDEWDRTLGVNLSAIFYCSKYAVPHMIDGGGGAIINTACVAGLYDAERNLAAYCASKGGAILLTKQMAIDYARSGIRVNCIAPGWVLSPNHNDSVIDAGGRERLEAYIDSFVPMGRQGNPEEVAALTLFLASDDASLITGTTVTADAGLSAQLAAPYIRSYDGAPVSVSP